MTEAEVGTLLQEALLLIAELAAPPLLSALVLGLLMSLVQAVTQVNEQTLAFVPKAVGVGTALLLLGGSMQQSLADFARTLMDRMVAVGSL